MSELVSFGSPLVTILWALSCMVSIIWLGRQLLIGRLVTIPSYVVVLSFLAPLIVQYPFAFSPLNILATGVHGFSRYPAHLDSVFLISLAGMLGFTLGFVLPTRVPTTFVPASFVSTGMRIWAQGTFLYISSLLNVALFLVMGLLGLLGTAGAREQAMLTPALRPLFNFVYSLLSIVTALALAVGWQQRRWIILLLGVINILLGVLTGTRAVVLGGITFFALAVFCRRSLSTGLSARTMLRIILLIVLMLVVAVYVGDARRGQYNPIVSILTIGGKLFYGNNFSDLRDFAWVRSYWNGHYFWGKTELAGILSFIPSVLSPFRREWGWGEVSVRLTGLDGATHPGLRPGMFGELYFNFGVPGVIVGSLLFGYVARRLHAVTKRAAQLRDVHAATIEILAAFVTLSLFATLFMTAGLFGVYVVVLTLLGLHLVAFVARGGTRAGRYPAVVPTPYSDGD